MLALYRSLIPKGVHHHDTKNTKKNVTAKSAKKRKAFTRRLPHTPTLPYPHTYPCATPHAGL